jgi:hypothetical protein
LWENGKRKYKTIDKRKISNQKPKKEDGQKMLSDKLKIQKLLTLDLTPIQSFTLRRWFKDARKTYNMEVDELLKNRFLIEKENIKKI